MLCFQEHMKEYRGKAFGTLSPHVFALAECAYSSLRVSISISLSLCPWTCVVVQELIDILQFHRLHYTLIVLVVITNRNATK